MSKPASFTIPLLLAALMLGACGVGEFTTPPWDDDEDPGREATFNHPPPPGPAPWTYVLTTYGGPSDASAYKHSTACGGRVTDGAWWYSTGERSFGCHSRLQISANGKCVVVEVVDNGPAAWVEQKANNKCGGSGYVIDASPLVSKHLFGISGAGWSDCKMIQVQPVAGNTPTGPCQAPAPAPAPTPGPSPAPSSCHPGQPFGWTYCSASCPCGEGMGDCDDDGECESGLVCAHNTGAQYGAGSTVDVCAKPASSGGSGSGSSSGSSSGSGGSGTSPWGSCSFGGYAGVCQDTTIHSCAGSYKSGLCPGGNNIKCCLPTLPSSPWGTCSSGGKTGVCQDTSNSCSTGYKSGLCPGGNNIKCCLP